MRMALGTTGGAPVEVAKAKIVATRKRRRLTNEGLLAVRREWMARMRDDGSPIGEIGALFRIHPRQVYRELALREATPDDRRLTA